ncbi:MAG: ribulose-phosphate 3-epimerase [Pseudomonadota bacterium]
MHRILASVLSADRRRLPGEVRRLVAAGADAIHMNVVEAEDRPNLNLGHLTCAAIRASCTLAIHVHLRVPASATLLERFAEAGADLLIVQAAAAQNTAALLAQVQAMGCQAGLAFGPDDALDSLPRWLGQLDLVHVSCARPASPARQFLPASLEQIARARALVDTAGQAGRPVRLQADGDIGPANIAAVAAAGADDIVIGRALFGSSDWAGTIAGLRRDLAAHHLAADHPIDHHVARVAA